MNIRENLITSEIYRFSEEPYKWQDHHLLKLREIISSTERLKYFKNAQIYLGLTDSPLIFLDDLKLPDSCIDPDFLLFASRHKSETARKAFLTHVTGNWSSETVLGGEQKQLSKASAFLLRAGFLSLKKQLSLPVNAEFSEYSLDIEVTHHGPTILKKPLLFMELGSSEKEWSIKNAGRLVAMAIMETMGEYLKLKKNLQVDVGIGFGGTHYAPQFRKLIDQKNMAISFICPKYYIKNLSNEMVKLMIDNTIEKVDYFIVDWKGINSQDKHYLLALLEEFEIPIKKTKDFQ